MFSFLKAWLQGVPMARLIYLVENQAILKLTAMRKKVTTQTIRKLKNNRPVVCVTAYDAVMTALVDRAEVDLILVGDSVGSTQMGLSTTVPVTMDDMVHHTRMVTKAQPKAMVVADIPFGVAHHSWDILLDACVRLMQEGGAEAVKIEGGKEVAPTIEKLVAAGIPVLGHIGLLPQRFHAMGGYRKFGKTEANQLRLVEDAKALEEAGVFAIVGEMIQNDFTHQITEAIDVPFIGIGAGPDCDGQILVCTDLLGMGTEGYPSFAKQYANLADTITDAVAQYRDEVCAKTFPEKK